MYKENKKGDKSSPWRTPTLQENKNRTPDDYMSMLCSHEIYIN